MARRDAVNDAPIRPHRVTKESSMPQIGEFTRTKNGYAGRIRTLSLDVEIALIPAEHTDAENAPDYRVHHGNDDGPEIGAGWKRTGEKAGDYVSLQIDDPAPAQPIRATLFQSAEDKSSRSLQLNRPPNSGHRDGTTTHPPPP